MGLKDLFTNNHKENEMDAVIENSEYSSNDVEIKTEEEEKQMNNKHNNSNKKKYMYIAFNKRTEEVAKKDSGEYIFSRQTSSSKNIEWHKADEMKSFLIHKEEYKVEVNEKLIVYSGKKGDVRPAIEDAKNRLIDMVSPLIKKDTEDISKTNNENDEKAEEKNSEKKNVENTKDTEKSVGTGIEENKNSEKENNKMELSKAEAVNEKNENDILQAISELGKQLGEDSNNLFDDLSGTIGQNGNEILSEAKKALADQKKDIVDNTQRTTNDAANYVIKQIKNSAQTNTESIVKEVKGQARISQDKQEQIAKKLGRIESAVEEWQEYDEAVLGKLNKVDEMAQILSDKGVTISQEIPPINADEEDIINLVRYSQKITEQLGFAARELIRKRESYESQKQGDENEQKILEEKLSEARLDGERQGQLSVIKALLAAFDGIDGIKDSDNDYLKAIWNKLKELGVEVDGDGYYAKGEVIELSGEDVEKMIATYPGITESAGKYKVKKSGLVYKEEVIVKAEFEKYEVEAESTEEESISQEEQSDSQEEESSQKEVQESENVSNETDNDSNTEE